MTATLPVPTAVELVERRRRRRRPAGRSGRARDDAGLVAVLADRAGRREVGGGQRQHPGGQGHVRRRAAGSRR